MGFILSAVPCSLCGIVQSQRLQRRDITGVVVLLLFEVVGETRRKYGHGYAGFEPYQNVDVVSGITSNQVLTLISDWCRY